MKHFGVRRFDAAFFLFFLFDALELERKEGKKAASNRRTPRKAVRFFGVFRTDFR